LVFTMGRSNNILLIRMQGFSRLKGLSPS
jgi:hypothetical protein